MRGIAMCMKWACSWSCADASSAWSPSRSLPRTSWGTLHPHPFRSANRVKRKDESRSCATGSNGLRSPKAFGFPSSSSCATVRASCATGVPCSSAILPSRVVYKAEIGGRRVGFYAFAIRVEIVASKTRKRSTISRIFFLARARNCRTGVFSPPRLTPRHGAMKRKRRRRTVTGSPAARARTHSKWELYYSAPASTTRDRNRRQNGRGNAGTAIPRARASPHDATATVSVAPADWPISNLRMRPQRRPAGT